MKIPPNYSQTPEMLEFITKIDALQLFFSSLQLSPRLSTKINRISLLKSSLFSAKIEGNSLNPTDVDEFDKSKEQIEIANIMKASRYVDGLAKKVSLDLTVIQGIHAIVLRNLDDQAGHIRKSQGAIYNQAGIVVYLTPPPTQVISLLEELFHYCNSKTEPFPLIQAFITHLLFEKIHPFIDGNGRVGRLLVKAVLQKRGYSMNLWVPFEEDLNNNKEEYYYYLDKGLTQTNDYIIYMLEMFYQASLRIKELLEEELSKKDLIILPPRQEELFRLISERSYLSLESIKRRFLKVPERTLRYDLKKLADLKLITKTGETKGAFYTTRKV